MNDGTKPPLPQDSSWVTFADSRQPPPSKRDLAVEALFYKQLQQVTARIHETENLEQIMLDASEDICKLFNAERLTLYAVNEDRSAIVSRIKTGLKSNRELKLPITPQSIAGYVAFSHQLINLSDVYDHEALKKIHPGLTFLKEVDKRSGYVTREMLVAPILEGDTLNGVLQLINNKSQRAFNQLEVDGVSQLCKTLAIAIRQRVQREADQARRKATKYDGLLVDGLLTSEQLAQCTEMARLEGTAIEPLLLDRYKILPAHIGASLARFFGVPYEGFNPARIRSEMLHGVLKREFVEAQGWLPLEESPEGLVIMCIDPEAVRNSRVVPQVYPRVNRFAYRVTTQTEFVETLKQIFGAGAEGGSIDELLADMDSGPMDDGSNDDSLESAAADNELVKFVNKVIIDAYHQKASDIHIEPMPGKLKTGIRFRIDGTLMPYVEVPAHFRQAMVTRLKIMCDLDISERRKPQDGKINFGRWMQGQKLELRVATIPTANGLEDVVMRLLASAKTLPLEGMGMQPDTLAKLKAAVERPYGMVLCVGPTGSGKTTTLHAALGHINTPERKIWTAEDPVEITQPGLRQVQVNPKIDWTFAKALRAFLRADPDVVMVGEIRDAETAGMAVEASLTGHLVMSTLHTNSAPETVTRLLDMGMDPFSFADSLLAVLAQRLVRRLCKHCVTTRPATPEDLQGLVDGYLFSYPDPDKRPDGDALLAEWTQRFGVDGQLLHHHAPGCSHCDHSGYGGRVGLHELLVVSRELRHLIQTSARAEQLQQAAMNEGMRTLRQDGILKVLAGLTSIEEVRAISNN